MSLWNKYAAERDGTPIPGQVPGQLVVRGPDPTAAQLSMVRASFASFLTDARQSVAKNPYRHGVLEDGSRYTINSINGVPAYTLWTEPYTDEGGIPHGFVVETGWRKPFIYQRYTKPSVKWKISRVAVPQAGKGIMGTNQVLYYRHDNSVFRKDKPFRLIPSVMTRTSKYWDYLSRGAMHSPDSTPFPLMLSEAGKPGIFNLKEPHFASKDKIYDKNGKPLFTHEMSDPILVSDAENPILMFAGTDEAGQLCVMQHMRWAIISLTANISKFRFCSEVVKRTSDDGYSASSRRTTDLVIPKGEQTVVSKEEEHHTLGEDLTDELSINNWESIPGGAGGGGSLTDAAANSVGAFTWTWGYKKSEVGLEPITSFYDEAIRQVKNTTPGNESVIPDVAAAGKTSVSGGVKRVNLAYRINFPEDLLWRAGSMKKEARLTMLPRLWWGTLAYEKRRIDTNNTFDGKPEVELLLPGMFSGGQGGVKDGIKVMEGDVDGKFTGHKYLDIKKVGHDLTWFDGYFERSDFVIPGIADMASLPYIYPPGAHAGSYAYMAGLNKKTEMSTNIIAEFPNASNGGNQNLSYPVDEDERPSNTGRYTYKSRHIIDFDYRAGFYAAIRVEVQCEGAKWKEDRGVYDGFMVPDGLPRYTVSIFFECRWKGTISDKLLFRDAPVERPPFEFNLRVMENVYYYGLPGYADRDIKVRMPPKISPPAECIKQVEALASHQGVNPHIASEETNREDIPVIKVAESKTGIEFSCTPERTAHNKYASGQLYARTFKIGDFSDALWLLSATKCNAKEGDFQPLDGPEKPAWFYHPKLKAAFDVVHHVGAVNGMVTDWVSHIPGAVPPEKRDIKLYRV